MSNPAFSVLLATANRARFLPEAIESVLAQTEEAFELLVLDCRSEDDTEAVVRAVEDSRVRYLYLDRADRAGVCAEGLNHARGKWVAFMDVHVRWDRSFLSVLQQALSGAPADTGVVYAPATLKEPEGDQEQIFPPGEPPEGDLSRALFSGPFIAPGSMLIRAELLKPLSQNRYRFWLSDDYVLSLWLACRTRFMAVSELLLSLEWIEGQGVRGLDPVSEVRGQALLRCLQEMPGRVPGRYGRKCLSVYYGDRAERALRERRGGEALGSALQGLLYAPFSFNAWRRLARVSVKG